MDYIEAGSLSFSELNETIRSAGAKCRVSACLGQRFIAAGMSRKSIEIDGIPGNALGAYLNGADITVHGNAQDAVGDTMSAGRIVIHGNIGDAAGYAMRGGEIFVEGNAGYRAGIHMKEYKEHKPVIVIGGRAGSFLGEYQAGGLIVVLALHTDGKPVTGYFPCTGMHGGKMVFRGDVSRVPVPESGDGACRHGGGQGGVCALCARVLPPVRARRGCHAPRSLHRRHAGQQKPL